MLRLAPTLALLVAFCLMTLPSGAQTLVGEIEGSAPSHRAGESIAWGAYAPVFGSLRTVVGVGSPGSSGNAGSVEFYRYESFVDDWVLVTTIAGGQPGDAFGFSLDAGRDLNFGSGDTWVVGAPGANGGTGEVSTVRVSTSSVLWTVAGTGGGSRFGHAVAVLDDINGDGYKDVLVGAPEQDVLVNLFTFASDAGVARVLSGLDGSVLRSHSGSVTGGNLGEAVCLVTDLNGDGVDDYAVGEPGFDVGGSVGTAGRVRVFSGATGNEMTTRTTTGPKAGARYGAALSTVDFDRDGVVDMIIGAPGFDSGTFPFQLIDLGRIEVRSGINGSALWQRNGAGAFSRFGTSVMGVPDFDEDGREEIVVGSPGADNGAGRVEVFSTRTQDCLYRVDGETGDELGSALDQDLASDGSTNWTAGRPGTTSDRGGISWWSAQVDWKIRDDRSLMGASVALLGDVDGDGIDDFAAGEYAPDLTPFIPVWRIFSGRTSARLHGEGSTTPRGYTLEGLADIDGDGTLDFAVGRPGDAVVEIRSGTSPGTTITTLSVGAAPSALFGHSMANVGDLDGDGVAEIAIGAPRNAGAGPDAGRVTVFSGLGGPPLFVHDGNPGDELGWRVEGLGDVNGDGVPDYGAGAPEASPGVLPSVGRVEVYSGLDGTVLFTIAGAIGTFQGSRAGFALCGPGDVNGDGFADIVVGEPLFGPNDEGRIRVVAGGPATASHPTLYTIDGTGSNQRRGHDVTAMGDINRDGVGDFAWVTESFDAATVSSGIDGSILESSVFSTSRAATLAGRVSPHADFRTPVVVGRPSLSGLDAEVEFMIMPFAEAIDLGGGCGGMTHPTLTSTPPRFGKTFTWSVSPLVGTPQQVVYVATSLPPAAPAGLGFGCEVHVDAATMSVDSFAFTGTSFSQSFVMPDAPFLAGFSIVRQAFNFDNAAPFAVALSNGERLTFGF